MMVPEADERPPRRGAAAAAVSILDVSPQLYPECLAVLHSGFATETARFGITRENTPSNPAFWTLPRLERVVARPAQLIAVSVGGRIVGCAFVLASGSRPATWELRHLAVVPDARHHGHGESLVAEAARRAGAAGATVLRIGIVAENVRLADWYRRLGFVSTGTDQYPGLPFTVEHLELALAASPVR